MFQSMINNIFWLYLDEFIIVYIDDIVIYAKTKKEYLEYVKKVFKALANHCLKTQLSKYIIGIKN